MEISVNKARQQGQTVQFTVRAKVRTWLKFAGRFEDLTWDSSKLPFGPTPTPSRWPNRRDWKIGCGRFDHELLIASNPCLRVCLSPVSLSLSYLSMCLVLQDLL